VKRENSLYIIHYTLFIIHYSPFTSRTFGTPFTMRYLFVVLAFFLISPLHAQHTTRLNDNWEFVREDLGGIWEVVRNMGKPNPESTPRWDSVTLPHCVNARDAVDPDVNYYQGPAWYRTLLTVDNPYNNGRTVLQFEGAGQKTEVYVYTTKVGSHVGGYDEWSVDITKAVEEFKKNELFQKQFNGKIPISIRTDNSRDLEMIPSNLSDFNLYGGIYRYLDLVYLPPVSLENLFVAATVDSAKNKGVIRVSGSFYQQQESNSANIQLNLYDPAGKLIAQKQTNVNNGKGTEIFAEFIVNKPHLWSATDPALYKMEVIINGEQVYTRTEKFGFRYFNFLTKGPFLLNGKRLLIRGTQRHEDHAALGNAMTEDLMRKEMIMIKEMGVNFIRLAHYQQSRIILDLCDSLGILVWEEIPWCRGGLGGEAYQAQAKRMLKNLITQHYNHPAVIIWGLGNENDWPGDFPEFDKEKIRAFMKQLNDLSHNLDPSRKTAIRRCDFCKDIVDVYSPSIWAGWYRGIYTEYKKVTEEEFNKVDHFLHMEWGGDSHAGRHSENPDKALQQVGKAGAADERAGDASLYGGAARVSKDGDWSESYICNLFDWHLKEQETMPWLTGTAQWIFKDFSTATRPQNPIPFVNQKGLVERDLTKKEGYYVFQSYWTQKPMAHIYGHSWLVRWGNAGEEKMVKVYSNCEQAELFVNGKSFGVKKRNSQDFPAAGLRWNVVLQPGANNIKAIAKKGKEIVTDEITFQYQTEKWNKPVKAILEKIDEANGIATLQVRVVDEKNINCLDAAEQVRFGLAGDGELIDDLGTSSGSRLVQLYNGRAIIRVKTNGQKNAVSATVKGLPTVIINL
jgi:beta-galactosidase